MKVKIMLGGFVRLITHSGSIIPPADSHSASDQRTGAAGGIFFAHSAFNSAHCDVKLTEPETWLSRLSTTVNVATCLPGVRVNIAFNWS